MASNLLNLAEMVVNELMKSMSKKIKIIPFSVLSLLNIKISRAHN